jgi:hypothetical protein
MARLQVGIIRYASVSRSIGEALGVERPPEVRIGRGRITVTFRQTGASRWPEEEQVDQALRTAATARRVLAADIRPGVRRRAKRAIEVACVDVFLKRGCAVESRWECVVPSHSSR